MATWARSKHLGRPVITTFRHSATSKDKDNSLRRMNKFWAHVQFEVTEIIECIGQANVLTGEMQLPSRQMIEYILVQFMVFSQLCAHAIKLCVITFNGLLEELSSGEFVGFNLMFVAMISRIWLLLNAFLFEVISWYSLVFPWRRSLQGTAVEWLPVDEQLPGDLLEWLDIENNSHERINSSLSHLSSEGELSTYIDRLFSSSNADEVSPIAGEKNVGHLQAQRCHGEVHIQEQHCRTTSSSVDIGEPVLVRRHKTSERKRPSTSTSTQNKKRARAQCQSPKESKKSKKVQSLKKERIKRLNKSAEL
ncbi:nucleolus and neural progenitor protein-like isoform X4 [Ptychodera flava]|uniref:nucleolus and neural progenitor protein-like isoform X4 n=1 Tax=Ptychodera flava TaxID=63121 RepID=UPI00396A6762